MTPLDLRGYAALRSAGRPWPARVAAVVVVGSSCSGKSTLVRAVREDCPPGICVPRRFVTRPRRGGDDPGESEHLEPAVFEARVGSGEIGLHWVRRMEGGRRERYGFAVPPAGLLPVYSGNDALCGDAAPEGALFVAVRASAATRERRMRERSPDLWRERPEEARHRLAEPPELRVHLELENDGPVEREAPGELRRFLAALARDRA